MDPKNNTALSQIKTQITSQQGVETAEQELARLRLENAVLKETQVKPKTDHGCKLNDSGTVSFYAGGRYPVSLYLEAWLRVIENISHIEQFVKANKDEMVRRSNVKFGKVGA